MNRVARSGRRYDGNISCLVRPRCRQLFFVYAGDKGFVEGMGPMTFLQSSSLGNRNVVFLRDPYSARFEQGVCDEIPSLDALIGWHLDYIAALDHVDEVYCTGNSMGGYASLLFGYMIGARKVWSFSPGGLAGLEMLRELMSEPNGVTEYDVHYSRRLRLDRDFAEALDGLDGLRLILNDAHGHLMIRGLMETGELATLFPPYRGRDA